MSGASHRIGPLVTITGTSLLVGCGSGGGPSCGSYGSSYGYSYGSCGYAYAAAGGIYEGTLSSTTYPQGTPVVALIAENGEGRISGADGSYYRIKVSPQGKALSGSFTGYSQSTPLANGAQSVTGSLSGTVTATTLAATLTDSTNAQQQLTLTANNSYKMSSPLATLAGTWSYRANGFTLTTTIQSNGAFTGSDSNNCIYSGSFSLTDPNFDEYAEMHVRSCNGVNTTFTGLAAFIPGSGTGEMGTATQLRLLSDAAASDYLAADLE